MGRKKGGRVNLKETAIDYFPEMRREFLGTAEGASRTQESTILLLSWPAGPLLSW